ncbi:L-type lectin-domain containing receptor kinase IX.2-like [Bidens hawaiensis]|uniref:L-type lectin-domain containing receptor kinase IX.2-like n=1 Tax=Bidens hawaiensis TaxID=980011 RepID=UPI00404AF099
MGDHIGISRSSRESDKYKKWLTNVPGGGMYLASVRYDSASKNLSVLFTGWQNNTFELDGFSDTIDLKEELPPWVIFGFSAATSGSRLQKNILRSWSFKSSGLDQNPHPAVNGKSSKMEDEGEDLEFCSEMNKDFERGSGPKRFSYLELLQSTSDFALKEKLREGGFGGVYKGFLKETRTYVSVVALITRH